MAEMTIQDVKNVVTEVVKEVIGQSVADAIAEKMDKGVQGVNYFVGAPEVKQDATSKGVKAAQILTHFAVAGGDRSKAAELAEKAGHIDAAKALTASDYASAGALISENTYDEIIELLTPETVMRSSGVQVLPLIGGNISMTREDQAPEAYYTGEGQDIVGTTAKFGQLKFTEKELNVLIPISNKLLRNGGPRVEQFIKNKMIQRMALKEDLQFLRGAGTEFSPKGLKNWIPAAMKNNMTLDGGVVTLGTITKDLLKAVNNIRRTDVKLTKGVWIFNSTVYTYLMSVRDGNGNLVFAPEMVGGTLFGFKFRVTSQVPYNLGSGSNESEIYLMDASYAYIFDVPGMDLSISNEASYVENGSLISAFSRNETLIKMSARHDFGILHETSAAMIEAVKWNF